MGKRVKEIDQPPASRTLQEPEITDLFDRLNLSTAADREKFLRLGQLSKDPNLPYDQPNQSVRVRLGNSTSTEAQE